MGLENKISLMGLNQRRPEKSLEMYSIVGGRGGIKGYNVASRKTKCKVGTSRWEGTPFIKSLRLRAARCELNKPEERRAKT